MAQVYYLSKTVLFVTKVQNTDSCICFVNDKKIKKLNTCTIGLILLEDYGSEKNIFHG